MLTDLDGFNGSLDVPFAFRTVGQLLPKQFGSLVLGRNCPLGDCARCGTGRGRQGKADASTSGATAGVAKA
jgi:hypothetical protein